MTPQVVPSQLRIPGPTPLPPAVLAALSQPMISHRSEEFHRLLAAIAERVQQVLGTRNEVVLLTASGTGGLEAAATSALRPGDRALSVSIGHFGERFAEAAVRSGASVDYLRFPPGAAADPDAVARRLAGTAYDAVLVTHCETSTGVLNDLPALSRALAAAPRRPLLLIDGVSSLAGVPLGLDDDEYDIAVTASQKAWMAPPGLSMVVVSERAWANIEATKCSGAYLDLATARLYAKRHETPWTPAVTLLYGLDAALDLILAEGIENVFARHRRLATRLRQGLRQLGLETLAAEAVASPTVTAVHLPPGVRYAPLSAYLCAECGLVIAAGQDELKGKVFRLGHMGYIADSDVEFVLDAIAAGLKAVTTATAAGGE
ncbi:MAG: pyridoxal-phosphate-dependent aminotransferase family protein [Anaerolineae bacterium]